MSSFSSAQLLSRVWLCNPIDCSMPGFPVHHQLPEFAQTHIHRVGDAIQPSHPLSFPSPPAPNPSQRQSFPMSQLFTWGGQSIGVSFQRTPRADLLQNGLVGFPCSPRVFSNTTVQKHQFFGAQLCSQSNSHIHTWPLEKPQPWLDGPLLQSVESQSWTQLSD